MPVFFRELLLDLLADRDFSLDTAETAQSAWEKLNRSSYDLLLIDVNLPDMSGLELITRLRNNAQTKELKILCMSGVYHKGSDAITAIRAGADGLYGKIIPA